MDDRSFYISNELAKQELRIPMSYDRAGSVEGFTAMQLRQVFGSLVEVKCRESIDGRIEPSKQYFVGSVASRDALNSGIDAIKFKMIVPDFRLVFQDKLKDGALYLFPGFVSADENILIRKPSKSKY